MSEQSITLDEAIEKIRLVLEAEAQGTDPHIQVRIVTWDEGPWGLRVAEVDYWRPDQERGAPFGAGSSYMQSDPPYGLAVCAQAERAILAQMHNDQLEAQEELDLLLSLVRDDATDPPETTADDEPAKPFILIAGNPVDGFTYTGPFLDHEDAVEDGGNHNGDWWVAPLATPGS